MSRQSYTAPRFRYGDYLQWHDGLRWELIDGEAIMMSPAPTRMHQQLLIKLARQIDEFLDNAPCQVYVAPFDVRLPKGDEADAEIDTVVQPDISVICDSRKLDDAGCRGAPDWIIEILSPSSVSMDQVRKAKIYARHGVKEYWIVDPRRQTVAVHRQIEGDRYTSIEQRPAQGHTEAAALSGLRIDWSRVFGG